MSETVIDAIVIGSGFGGAVTAARLAEGGVGVVLLERGPWRDTVATRSMGVAERTPFPRGWRIYTQFLRTINASYLPGGRVTTNRLGLIELFYSKGLEVICSSGVGGGSHVYSAVHRRPADDHYWDGHCDGLSEETMAGHYDSFLARMGSTLPGEHNRPPNLASERYHNSPIVEPVRYTTANRVGFLLPEDPRAPKTVITKDGVERREADYANSDNGFLGSPSGAKSTLDICYLAPAMKKGLGVRDLCEVVSVTATSDKPGRYRVDFIDLRNGGQGTLRADNVFMGAGAMNTLRILLASRDRFGGLDEMPGLGRRFGANGDMRGFWDIDDFEGGMDQTTGLPSKGGIVLRDSPDPRLVMGRNSLPSVSSYPLPKRIRDRLKRGMVVSGMGVDAMDGVVSLQGGKMKIDFDPSHSPIFAQYWEAMKELERRSGRPVYVSRRPSTVHPTGGACMGADATTAVVDAAGQVRGHPGLYITDSAALPAPVAAPPTASIAAWSENVASRFLAGG